MGNQKNDPVKTTATQYIIQNPDVMKQNASLEKARKGGQNVEMRSLETRGNPEKQKVSRNSSVVSDNDSDLSNSLFQIQIQNSQTREIDEGRVGLGKAKAGKKKYGPNGSIDQEQSMSSNIREPPVGQRHKKIAKNEEVTSPIKAQKEPTGEQSVNKEIAKAQGKKGKWKKLARGQTKSNGIEMEIDDCIVGIKRSLWAEEENEEGMQKRARAGESGSFN